MWPLDARARHACLKIECLQLFMGCRPLAACWLTTSIMSKAQLLQILLAGSTASGPGSLSARDELPTTNVL